MSSVLDVFVQRSTIIQLVQGTFPEDAGKEPDQSRRLMADAPLMYFDRASGRRRTVSLVMGAILVLMATSYTAAAQTPPPPTLKLLPASGESPDNGYRKRVHGGGHGDIDNR